MLVTVLEGGTELTNYLKTGMLESLLLNVKMLLEEYMVSES